MPRVLQFFVLFLTASALIALVVAPGCSDECKRVDDCMHGEVCYKGICTQNSAEYVRCDTNDDCDPSMSGQFICKAARCVFKSTGIVPTDAGPTDNGMHADATMPAPDATGNPDAIVNPDAMSMDALDDAGTSTIGDAGTSTIGADM